MSDSDATTIPTPNMMPGAATAVTRTSPGSDTTDTSLTDDIGVLEALGDAVDAADEIIDSESDTIETSVDDIAAERDKWKRQAQNQEKRAKANAEKAKAYDADYERFKAAYEREQQRGDIQDDSDDTETDEAALRAEEAEARAHEAEANLLRYRLAEGIPDWAIGLIDGETEEEITEQVDVLKENLAAYLASATEARRPAPNPLAGRGGQLGGSPKDDFASAFSQILR